MKFVVDPKSRNLFGKDNKDIDNIYDAYIYRAKQIMIFMIWGLIVAAIIVTVCWLFTDNGKLQCISVLAFLFVGIFYIITYQRLVRNRSISIYTKNVLFDMIF